MIENTRKIRFTRRDIIKIERSLDADGAGVCLGAIKPKRSLLLWGCWAVLSSLLLFIMVAGIGFVALRGGVKSDFLRDEAEKTLATMLGTTTTISGTNISFSKDNHLAIEAMNVSIDETFQGITVKNIDAVRLGLSPLPLLAGNIQVAQLELEGADITLAEGKNNDFLQTLPLDAQGLIDFDAVSALVFEAVGKTVGLLDQRETKAVRILDTDIHFRVNETDQILSIQDARLDESNGKIHLVGEFLWQGRLISLDGDVERASSDTAADTSAVSAFNLQIKNIPLALGSPPNIVPNIAPEVGTNRVNPAYFELMASAALSLSGTAARLDSPQNLIAELNVDGIDFTLGRNSDINGHASLKLNHVTGSGKIEVNPSQLVLGGLQLDFNGAFGPDPEQPNTQGKPSYRFEVVTSRAISAPALSGEPPLAFALGIAGRFETDQNRLQFSSLDVKTSGGELYGQGGMAFGHGSPEMIFLLRIPTMPVSHAKQIWPLDVADGARDWVFKNLFGGTLKDSQIDVALAAGRFNGPGLPPPLTADEIKADFKVNDTRFDVIGELPPVRDADGEISVRGSHATIRLSKGTAFTPHNRQINVSDGTLIIPWGPQRPVMAALDMAIHGDAAAITELIGNKPIDILKKLPFTPEDMSGAVQSRVKLGFAISKGAPPGTLVWNADIGFNAVSITKPISGQLVTKAQGTIKASQGSAVINADALLNGIPARVAMTEPIDDASVVRQQTVRLEVDDKVRAQVLPGLNSIFSGPMSINLGMVKDGKRAVVADLGKTQINLPWLGWKKGAGVAAKANFDLIMKDGDSRNIEIDRLDLVGDAFRVSGKLSIANNKLKSIDFNRVKLNRNDDLSVKVAQASGGYRVGVRGSFYDARALLAQINSFGDQPNSGGSMMGNTRIVIDAQIADVAGFNNEHLKNVAVSYEMASAKTSSVSVNANTASGKSFVATNSSQSNARSISLQSTDAGAILRFFDFYSKMHGGQINVGLAAQGDGPLGGQIDARNFSIIDEPRLASIVSSPPPSGGTSLNQAVKRSIDVSRVDFERGYSLVEKGQGYVKLAKGVVRGPLIGTTFQGTLYDGQGNMAMTGTFMPAYGLNRLFAELPILGVLLGNGRDRGLIGITYKMSGNAKQPKLTINPISVIAPGIFRSIFEFQ